MGHWLTPVGRMVVRTRYRGRVTGRGLGEEHARILLALVALTAACSGARLRRRSIPEHRHPPPRRPYGDHRRRATRYDWARYDNVSGGCFEENPAPPVTGSLGARRQPPTWSRWRRGSGWRSTTTRLRGTALVPVGPGCGPRWTAASSPRLAITTAQAATRSSTNSTRRAAGSP